MSVPGQNPEESFWVAAAALDAETALLLRASASGETEPGLALARAVDESGHGLAEWLGALRVLHDWVRLHPRPPPWSVQLGYIGCSSDYARSRVASLPLTEVVRDFLESHGFDGGNGGE